MREFAETISARLARSRAAAVRAHIERNAATLAERVDEGMGAMEVDIAWVRTARPDGGAAPAATVEDLVLRAAPEASDALVRALGALGLERREEIALSMAWAAAGGRHAKRWVARQATLEQWHRTVTALQGLGEDPDENDATLARLGALAQCCDAWVPKLAHCDTWLAREACRRAPMRVLAQSCGRWRAWMLAEAAGRLGEERPVGEDAARAALADWRWPAVCPPLRVAGVGAGRRRPIAGDAAWANAIAAQDEVRRAAGEDPLAWLARVRMGEDGALERAQAKIAQLAKSWVALRHASEGRGVDTVLSRWRTQWARCEGLAGDGTIARPRLVEAQMGGRESRVWWAFPVRGPETYIAACVMERREPAKLVHAALSATLEVCVRPHIDTLDGRVHFDDGRVRFDEDAVRERAGDTGPARRGRGQARGALDATVEAALRRAPVIGEMHALAGLREEETES